MRFENDYTITSDIKKIAGRIAALRERSDKTANENIRKKIHGLIDLTSLNVTDNDLSISSMAGKVNSFHREYRTWPNVAAVCAYPPFIQLLASRLEDKNVKIASVAASFPSSQTFMEIKSREVEKVIEAGADEVDVVIPVGKFLQGKYEDVFSEIHSLKQITGRRHLKVILETGILNEPEKIKAAAFISLEAGADFIKTSTGKNGTGASPEAVYVMCEAIKEFYLKTGKAAGIKPAGGISDTGTAVLYYLIVEEVLGSDWLLSSRFRIGASRLANSLLGETYF